MSRAEGSTRRGLLPALTPACLCGARTSTLHRCQKLLRKRWTTTVASGHLKQRRVTRSQSFLSKGNDIDGQRENLLSAPSLAAPEESSSGGREVKEKGTMQAPRALGQTRAGGQQWTPPSGLRWRGVGIEAYGNDLALEFSVVRVAV